MKLMLAKSKLELVGKTLMDLAKVTVVGTELFKTPSMKIRLIGTAMVCILFLGGWLVYPAKEEKKDVS